jgi:hypothetical protein
LKPDLLHEVERAESLWRQASLTNSEQDFDALLAQNFLAVLLDGVVVNRTEFLKRVSDGSRKIKSVKVDDTRIEILHPTAVVICTQTIEAEFKGVPFSGPARATRVWSNFEGHWKLVSFHNSDVRILTKWDDLKKR